MSEKDILRYFGVIVSNDKVAREMRQIGKKFNRGRGRKVSVKRPSPQLSRNKLDSMRVQARINAIARTPGGE